jgi:membrane dipeptidase
MNSKPVAYTHCAPAGFKVHLPNKSDEELKLSADKVAFVGSRYFRHFLPAKDSAVDDYIEAVEYAIDLMGEEQVGHGTDLTQE